MRVIACVNQKGGVGKTTLCANLARALSRHGQVLAIDCDPQAHLGQSLGLRSTTSQGIDALLQAQATVDDVAQWVSDGLQVITAGSDLSRLESVPMGRGKGRLLKKALANIQGPVDIVLLDCPPSSGFLVVNALAAATELLMPVTADYLGMSGLSHLMHSIKNFERLLGTYQHKWVLLSRVQKRRLSDEVKRKLEAYFPDQLLPVQITERAVLAECPSHGQSVLDYAPRSQSSREFKQLADVLWAHGGGA